jgi:CRISPR-associated protein Cas2
MSMTVVVTRNVSHRMRGFLASSMLELAPGVYSSPKMSPAVRERVWTTVSNWFTAEEDASVMMLWADPTQPGGQSVKSMGLTPVQLINLDGLLIAHRPTG